jgi:hypothetical protein
MEKEKRHLQEASYGKAEQESQDASARGDHGPAGDAAARRMAGGWTPPVVPTLKPEVVSAIQAAAAKLTAADMKTHKYHGFPLGTYVQVGAVTLSKDANPKGLPANAYICFDPPPDGQAHDPNVECTHFFVRLNNDNNNNVGPLEFQNPLVHAAPAGS